MLSIGDSLFPEKFPYKSYDKLVISSIMESKYLWKAMSLSLHS